jgi:uncharacterized protein involved in response to NO
MIFGFAIAVFAGFLLTAVGNWTGRETLVGTPLLAAGALWALGRVGMALAGSLPRGVPALVDLASRSPDRSRRRATAAIS